MYTDTEGIILRQTKINGGRRMLTIFTKKYGKISAGSFLSEKSRSRNALAVRPFTYGRYDLYKKGTYFSINNAETIDSFYRIGEDLEKYTNASYCLEMTDKLLEEGQPVPGLFNLAVDMLRLMEKRTQKYSTLVLAYCTKALAQLGYLPELDRCVRCGSRDEAAFFSVPDGGILCGKCGPEAEKTAVHRLIYKVDFGIVNILKFFLANPLESLEKLALNERHADVPKAIIREHLRYHLGIDNLKSEELILQKKEETSWK